MPQKSAKIMTSEDGIDEKIKIFSTDDERLKFLGELLSNESSRAILLLITEKEMSANDIAEKIDLRLSLVIHHINKMIHAKVVQVSRTEKNTKNHDVKYYLAKPGILIFPKEIAGRAKKSKTLSSSLRRVFRFTSVGIAGMITYFVSSGPGPTQLYKMPRPELPNLAEIGPYVLPLIVVIIGLLLMYFTKKD